MTAAGILPASGNPSSSKDPGSVAKLKPSGDTTGATDTVALNAALKEYPVVVMLPGRFGTGSPPAINPWYVNAPIVVPSGRKLTGDWYWQAVDSDNYSAGPLNTGGVLITAVAGFAGDAVITIVNGGQRQQGAQVIEGLTIEGNELPAGSGIHGVLVEGAVGAGFIRGVTVHRPDGDCLRMVTDQASGFVPDCWQVAFSKFSASRNGNGVFLSELPDSWFVACESSENYGDNWYCSLGTNTRFIGCKGENSQSANGWHFGGLGTGQVIELTGCTSQLNAGSGFLFDNSGGSSALGTYTLTGCRSWRDGRAGGSTHAAFNGNGCASRVIGTGCVAAPDSTGAAYGARESSRSHGMCFTGSLLSGTVASVFDDGSNAHALVNQSPVPF